MYRGYLVFIKDFAIPSTDVIINKGMVGFSFGETMRIGTVNDMIEEYLNTGIMRLKLCAWEQPARIRNWCFNPGEIAMIDIRLPEEYFRKIGSEEANNLIYNIPEQEFNYRELKRVWNLQYII